MILEDVRFLSPSSSTVFPTTSSNSNRWRNLAHVGPIRFLMVVCVLGALLFPVSRASASCGSVKRELNYQFFQTAPNFDILIALNAHSDEKANRATKPDKMAGKTHGDSPCNSCRGRTDDDRSNLPSVPPANANPRIALISSNLVIKTIGRDVRETVRSEIVLLDSASLESLERPPISC